MGLKAMTVGLQVCSLRLQPEVEPKPGTSRLGDGALLAAKAAALTAAALALLASYLGLPLPRVLRNQTLGLSISCPPGWEDCRLPKGLAMGAFKSDGRLSACVTLWRFSWPEIGAVAFESGRSLSAHGVQPDLFAALSEQAAWLGFGDCTGPVDTMTLDGRPALMLTAQAPSGKSRSALVVALGEDLVSLHLFASSEADLRAVWPLWKSMIRSVRVTRRSRPSAKGSDDGKRAGW